MINKIGAEKVLSIYWFAILVIVAGGIIAMVSIFYGKPYDVREIEANTLINKVSDCLSEHGRINNNLLIETGTFNQEFSLLEECNLNFNVESGLNDEQGNYYVGLKIYNLDSEKVFEIDEGSQNFISDCSANPEKKYQRLVKCVEREFYVSDNSENVYLINVLSIIRKTEKNVK